VDGRCTSCLQKRVRTQRVTVGFGRQQVPSRLSWALLLSASHPRQRSGKSTGSAGARIILPCASRGCHQILALARAPGRTGAAQEDTQHATARPAAYPQVGSRNQAGGDRPARERIAGSGHHINHDPLGSRVKRGDAALASGLLWVILRGVGEVESCARQERALIASVARLGLFTALLAVPVGDTPLPGDRAWPGLARRPNALPDSPGGTRLAPP